MIALSWSGLANHLWQSTAFALLIAVLTLALRRNRAHLRYLLWLAASLKFLVPFSWLVGLGTLAPRPQAPVLVLPLPSTVQQVALPFDAIPIPLAGILPATAFPLTWLLPLWTIGSAFVLLRWARRWNRVRSALRGASTLPIDAPIPVKATFAALEPGVFGLFRPVLLLPRGIAARLSPAQFRAILAHELCHVRRHDNLTAALHMLVEAVFWFHPLVWWIGARLVEERERACDQAVLSAGDDPAIYAAGILTVCRFCLESPLPCAPGVTGADLKKRIEEIMTTPILARLSPARRLLLAAAALAAIGGPIAVGVLDPTLGRAQTSPRLRFEVASIKPAASPGGRGGLQVLPGGGLRMEGVTLLSLVTFAYGVHPSRVTGAQKWMDTEAYQLIAKPERPEAADNPSTTVAPGTTAWSRLEMRLQALLEERFHLAVHTNVREESGFALVQVKSGTRLTPEPAGSRPPGTVRDRTSINGRNGTMTMLATVLSQLVGRPVEDRTGLEGGYTYKLTYAPDSSIPGPDGPPEAAPAELTGPSVFSALQEQLGLRLEPAKLKVQTLVIEHAERPSAN